MKSDFDNHRKMLNKRAELLAQMLKEGQDERAELVAKVEELTSVVRELLDRVPRAHSAVPQEQATAPQAYEDSSEKPVSEPSASRETSSSRETGSQTDC